jgi:hypothetical protein
MEFFRDQAAHPFERHTRSAWRPRSGSAWRITEGRRTYCRQMGRPPQGATDLLQAKLDQALTKHAKAAPFKRNDQMLDVLPIGVMCSRAPGCPCGP